MTLIVRTARADELVQAQALVARSINDLTVRHGFGPIATARAPGFQAFCLADDPRGAWVAEADGELAGFAQSWVCGPLWFLAELFVAPGRQGQGIGRALMEATLQQAQQAGATEKALITFTFNLVSQRLYAGFGLLPRVPLHLCSADREVLAQGGWGPALATTPIRATDADLQWLRRLDGAALGVSREKHHRYLLADAGTSGVFLDDGRERVGYAYVSPTGHVGPLAVLHAQWMPAAVGTALAVAAAGEARRVSVFIPGPSPALAIAARTGMRFTLPMVLMSARDFGDWTRYLPRNPGFM